MSWLSLIAQLGININPYVQGLYRARAEASSFGKNVASTIGGSLAGAFSAGAILSTVKHFTDMGGRIEDLHKRTELTRSEVQALDYAAEQASASFEDMAKGLKQTALSQEAALNGNKEKLAEFQRLGVTLDDLRKKTAKEIFIQISEAIHQAGDSSGYLTSMLGVMGNKSDVLIPAMKEGIGSLITEFEQLGLAIEDDVIVRLDQMGDEWDTWVRKTKRDAAPWLTGLTDWISAMKNVAPIRSFPEMFLHNTSPLEIFRKAWEEFKMPASMLGSRDARFRSLKRGADAVVDFSRDGRGKETDLNLGRFFGLLQNKENGPTRINADSMARVGAFLGYATRLNNTQQTNQYLKKIADNTDPKNHPTVRF